MSRKDARFPKVLKKRGDSITFNEIESSWIQCRILESWVSTGIFKVPHPILITSSQNVAYCTSLQCSGKFPESTSVKPNFAK